MAVRFFLQNSAEYYAPFDEDYEAMQWLGSDAAIYTGFDSPHGSCMSCSVSSLTAIYQLFDVQEGAKYVFEAEYRSANTVVFEIADVTNGGLVVESIACAPSTPHWSNFYHEETLASNCVQARLYVYGCSSATQTVYLDNVRWQGNAITFDPEIGQHPYSYQDSSERHVMQDGSMRITKSPRRLYATLHFGYLTHDQFTRLQQFINANTETWFDDQAVPNSVDVGYCHTESTDTYASTLYNHAYFAGSQTLTASATVFEVNEFGGLAYAALAVDDSNYAGTATGAASDYLFHKFSIGITEISDITEIQTLDIVYKGATDNVGAEADGVKLFLWDGNKYVEVDSAYSSDKSTLNFSTSKPSLAQRFIYASGATLYIKAIARSSSANLLDNDIQLNSYYFQTTINENLSDTITLKNKAILDDSGDVVEVKNITRNEVLTLATDYRVGEDRQSIVLTSAPTAGDRIQVEYAKYWYVYPFGDFSENRFDPATATAPGRSVDLILEGVTTI